MLDECKGIQIIARNASELELPSIFPVDPDEVKTNLQKAMPVKPRDSTGTALSALGPAQMSLSQKRSLMQSKKTSKTRQRQNKKARFTRAKNKPSSDPS